MRLFFKKFEFQEIEYLSKSYIFISAILLTIGITTSIAITNIALTIGFVGLLMSAVSKSFNFKKDDTPILLLFAQNILSVFGLNIRNSFNNLNIIRFFLPYFVLSRMSEKHKFIVNLLGLVTIFTSLCIIINAFFGMNLINLLYSKKVYFHFPPDHGTALWSTNPLATGSIMMMLTLLFLTLSFYYRNGIYYISAFLGFLSLFLIQERSAILGFTFGIILIPFFINKVKFKKIVFFYTVVILVFVVLFQFSFINKRFSDAFHYKKDTSVLLRLAQWDAAINAMPKQNLKTILFGFGLNNADKAILQYKLGSFKKLCNKYSLNCATYTQLNGIGYMDNLYFQTLIDYGIFGELLLLMSFFLIIRNNLAAKPTSEFSIAFNKATTIAFMSFLVSSLFFSAFLYTDFVYFLMYLLGLNESIKIWDSSTISLLYAPEI